MDAIVGWRVWRFRPSTSTLRSAVRDVEWPKGEPLRSEDLRQHPYNEVYWVHAAPTEDNAPVGIHAWRTRQQLSHLLVFEDDCVMVWGQVSLWGQVVEHAGGYRAELAYPLSIELLPGLRDSARALADAYGIEATAS